MSIRRFSFLLTCVFPVLLAGACSSSRLDVDEGERYFEDTVSLVPTETLDLADRNHPAYEAGVRNAIDKARLMAEIRWKALAPVPSTIMTSYRWDYPQGGTYHIPYSSVKELDMFVGRNVSFYTFLSAAANERSVLYTEDVSLAPYHGYNCGAFYGTVCSSSVCFALGIRAPYPSRLLNTDSDLIRRVESQSLEDMRLCDIWASDGHSILVIGIVKDEQGSVSTVEVLDVYTIRTFSAEDFRIHCNKDGLSLFRYYNLSSNGMDAFNQYSWTDLQTMVWNPDLSPARGDRSCFRVGEDVMLNLFSTDASALEVFRDGELYEQRPDPAADEILSGLPVGRYTARLAWEDRSSQETSFEILETGVRVSKDMKGNPTIHYESGNAEAVAIVICDDSDTQTKRFVRDLTPEEKAAGQLELKGRVAKGKYLCKVYFKGDYGVIRSEPVPLSM